MSLLAQLHRIKRNCCAAGKIANAAFFFLATAASLLAQQVTIAPANVSLIVNQTRQFSATLTGLPGGVGWSIGTGDPAMIGSIDSTGFYRAPAAITIQRTVTVTATSTANSSIAGSAAITLKPILLSISPGSANVGLEHTQQFTASVQNGGAGVTWSLNPAAGSISGSGLYTAPALMPSPSSVTVTATSVDDPSKSASINVAFIAVSISLSPGSANVIYGRTAQFTATVNNSGRGATWSIVPPTDGGTISSSGLYTAPATAGAVHNATITATAVADPAKSTSATVAFVPVTISMSPGSANLNAGQTRQFTASVTNGNSQLSPQVLWTLSPPGAGTISGAGLYTAPASVPVAQTVTVIATSATDASKSATATVTLAASPSVTVSPATASIGGAQTQQYAATVTGLSSTSVGWSITPVGVGSITGSGLYSSPAAINAPQTVTITATSVVDSTRSGSASLNLQPVSVSVSPSTATISASGSRQFSATVANTGNTAVTWSVTPTGAGTISAAGLYTAPAAIASQQTVTVTATSQADATKSASASVTLSPAVLISVAPSTTALSANGTQQFSATVINTTNTVVIWSLTPAGAGTISAAGLYTAPASIASQQTVTVTAVSQADNTKSASASVTLSPGLLSLTVAPPSVSLHPGQTRTFTASVTGSSNTAVTWSLDPAGAGTITAAGLYTAPSPVAAPQSVTVIAVSQADGVTSSTATVTLQPPVSITVAPNGASIYAGRTAAFGATVANSDNTSVNWTVSPSNAGSIDATGLYTAPDTVGAPLAVLVTATSQADTSNSASVTLTVNPGIAISLNPPSTTVYPGQTSQFTATVTNTPNTAVIWSISPSDAGSISTTGLYTPPAGLTASEPVIVTATSVADSSFSTSAPVVLSSALLTSIVPNTARAGDVVNVTIAGSQTDFTPGNTQASLGDGITVGASANTADGAPGPVAVTSAIGATATIAVNRNASPGTRDLLVQTPSGQMTLPSAFTVTPPPPQITITAPDNLSFTNISPATVRGIVSDPTASITVNGIAAANAQGGFVANVPLSEGNNIVTVVASSGSGALTGSASIEITLDTAPPHLTVVSPVQGLRTMASSITVSGIVNDVVVGTVNDRQATVTVNGTPAQVANRSFIAPDIPLTIGANTLQVSAIDRSGNSVLTSLTVERAAPTQPRIQVVSGDGQSAPVSSLLPAPLVLRLVDVNGIAQANRPVVFQVARNNGSLNGGSGAINQYQSNGKTVSVVANTDAQGQASVQWQLGSRSGAGINRVEASAAGFSGPAVFTASGSPALAAQINVDAGSGQTGAVSAPLPFPLVVVVTDAGHNRLAGVPVTFSVSQGGGAVNGQSSIEQITDSDGRALAVLTLGPREGIANNRVDATFPGNTGAVAHFSATALRPGDPASTRITGVVLDNSNQPVAGVTMRMFLPFQGQTNNVPVPLGTPVQTDSQGVFVIQPAPVGKLKLMADGGTAQRPGSWATVEFDMVTVAGGNNTLGVPVYLLPLDPVNKLCVSPAVGGTLTLPQTPGFSLTVAPDSATFPGGSRSGCISVTPVHPDKVPMVPGFGQQPRFIVTIQPVGTSFNPPAAMTLPNVDGLAPNEITEMYSFDHDLSTFVAVGTATVSVDGQLLKSDPGVGVLKAGWHGSGPPAPTGDTQNTQVAIDPLPILAIEQGTTGVLSALGTPGPGQYAWQLPAALGAPQGGIAGPSVVLSGDNVGIGQASVAFVDSNTSATATASTQVIVARLDIGDPVLAPGEQIDNSGLDPDDGDDPDYSDSGTPLVSSARGGRPALAARGSAVPNPAKMTGIRLRAHDTAADCPTGSAGTPGPRTFLGDSSSPAVKAKTGDSIQITACATGFEAAFIPSWTIVKKNNVTADATPLTGTGTQFTTRGKSSKQRTGSIAVSAAMEYQVTAKIPVGPLSITKTVTLHQDPIDVLRQEYADFAIGIPPRDSFSDPYPAGSLYNRGPYSSIPVFIPNTFEDIRAAVEASVRTALVSDIQVIPPVAAGDTSWQCAAGGPPQSQPCPAGTVVVTHAPALPVIGKISNTVPTVPDKCSIAVDPKTGACKGDIIVGPDGKPHTLANNLTVGYQYNAIIESGYRNPEYNRSPFGGGSLVANSAHTYGFALDFHTTRLNVPGKTDAEMMCLVKLAGDQVPGVRRSAAELRNAPKGNVPNYSHWRTQCDNSNANHVHIDVGSRPWTKADGCQVSGTGDNNVNPGIPTGNGVCH